MRRYMLVGIGFGDLRFWKLHGSKGHERATLNDNDYYGRNEYAKVIWKKSL